MKRLKIGPATEWVEVDPELSLEVRVMDVDELADVIKPLVSRIGEPTQGGLGEMFDRISNAYAVVLAFIDAAVTDWTVVDDDTDQKLPITAENARALLRTDKTLIASIMNKVVTPAIGRAQDLAAEKNVSGSSPIGTSAGASTTAAAAKAAAKTAPAH